MSTLRQVALLAANDVRLTVKDRAAFLWMLLLPIALMWVFGQMGGGGTQEAPKVSLAVEDQDGGWLAQALVAELTSDRVELTRVPAGGPGGTQATLGGKETEPPVRTLVIPRGFTAGALAGRQQVLRLVSRSGSSEEFSLAAQAHTLRAITRILARLAETGPDSASDGAFQSAASVDTPARRAAFAALAHRPPMVALRVTSAGHGQPVPHGYAQSVPGMLTMFVLMMTLIYGAVFLTTEKTQGMLRRQMSLPLGRGHVILGKVGGRLLMAGLQTLLFLVAGRLLYGLSWGSSPAGLALVLCGYATAVAGLSTLMGALLSTPEQASAVGWILSMVLSALGGCWWPSEVMPPWLWRAAHVLPTAWAMDALHALVSFGRGVDAVLLPAAVLFGFGALFPLLGSRFLRHG